MIQIIICILTVFLIAAFSFVFLIKGDDIKTPRKWKMADMSEGIKWDQGENTYNPQSFWCRRFHNPEKRWEGFKRWGGIYGNICKKCGGVKDEPHYV